VIEWEPAEGEKLRLEGFWKLSEFNGKDEFIFRAATLDFDMDPGALLHYAVELTKGMGPAAESAIWARYHEDWRAQEELDVPGINATARLEWKMTLERLAREEHKSQTVGFLLSHGCTMRLATVAWQEWEAKTLTKVSADPYVITRLPNFGFHTVEDGIRQSFGIANDDPRRLRAAVYYAAGQISERDGTAFTVAAVIEECRKLVPDVIADVGPFASELVRDGDLVALPGEMIALKTDHENEVTIWERMSRNAGHK